MIVNGKAGKQSPGPGRVAGTRNKNRHLNTASEVKEVSRRSHRLSRHCLESRLVMSHKGLEIIVVHYPTVSTQWEAVPPRDKWVKTRAAVILPQRLLEIFRASSSGAKV